MKTKRPVISSKGISLMLVLALLLILFASCTNQGKPKESSKTTNSYGDDESSSATLSEVTGDISESDDPSDKTGSNTNKTGSSKNSSTKSTSTNTKPKSGEESKKGNTSVDDEKKYDTLSNVPKGLSGQKIKVLIWWNAHKEDLAKAAKFKEKTGITVTFETTSLDNFQTRLSSMVMANNSPSIAPIIADWYPQPITRNLMQPIDVTGWNFKDEIYSTEMMEQFSANGKYYGMALKGSLFSTFIVMFWNKNIFRQKGLTTTPETLWKSGNWNWDTCLDLAKKTTNTSKGEYGLTQTYQYFWMLSAGQDFVIKDKNKLVNNLKNQKLVDTWNFAWDTIYTHKVVDTSFTAQSPFYSGKAAMFAGGSFFMQSQGENYVPKNMKDEWGVVPFPSPAGQAPVAACEGIVWGFPARVTGDKLQAAAWFLRYFLDDAANEDPKFYPKQECWDIMNWMWKQKIQSYNSLGILTYGGEHKATTIQYDLIDEADSKAKLKSNLDSWYSVFDTNINKILSEFE